MMFFYPTMFREFGFFLMSLSLFNAVAAFNIDLSRPVIFSNGVNQSMFGFTVAAYKENGKSWVLVGAPKNRDEYFSKINRKKSYSGYNGTYQGGSLYSCDVSSSDVQQACSVVRFPTASENPNENENYIDRQGLGASLATSGSDGVVMVCAPRVHNVYYDNTSYVTGACYYSKKGINHFTKYSLFNANNNGGRDQLLNREAGFSTAISKDSETFYSGAVSAMGDRGYLLSLTLNQNNKLQSEGNNVYNATNTTDGRSNFFSYFGYSLTTLNFSGTKEKGVAIASPKNNFFKGTVTIFSTGFPKLGSKDLAGEELGAYFGYSICTSDMDGDGADDLIIGSPLYSDSYNPSNKLYNQGRIFVYYQGNISCKKTKSICWENKFNKFDFIDGEHSRGYFGFAIASLGDINRDGFGDIVVGAPYQEWTENCPTASCTGAVYIYHGSSQGIVKKYSQVIKASDIYHLSPLKNLPLISFGSSLSGGLDLDGNSYPDLVVGAVESDVVFLFRSKPIISLTTNVSFLKSRIALDEYSCTLKNETKLICVDLNICLQYDGKDAENQTKVIVDIILDHGKSIEEKRMFFYNNGEEKKYQDVVLFSANRNKKECKNITTYVAHLRENQDKLSSMEVQVRSSLATSTNEEKKGSLSGVLNNGPVLFTKGNLHIKNNCGEDDICIPYLSIFMNSTVENFIIRADSENNLDLNVFVTNQGEDSYNSVFKLKVPEGLRYSNFKNIQSSENEAAICKTPNADNGFTIECNIGNPLPAGITVGYTITFETDGNTIKDSKFKFLASVDCMNLEMNAIAKLEREKSSNISVTEVPNVLIKGLSTPREIHNISSYNSENTETHGPFLSHKYLIQNLGMSEISEAIATFYWPLKSSSGESLLQLISDPVTDGSVFCNRTIKNNEIIDHVEATNDSISSKNSVCSTVRCVRIQCMIKNLSKNQNVSVTFSSVVWAKTIQKMPRQEEVRANSFVEVKVTKLASNIEVANISFLQEVFTNIKTLDLKNMVSVWIIVVSAWIGVLLLMGIVFVMYKRIKKMVETDNAEENLQHITASSNSTSEAQHEQIECNSTIEDHFTKLLNKIPEFETASTETIKSKFKSELESYFKIQCTTGDEESFWKKYQPSFPNIHKLWIILKRVPVTEVSCERLFSALKFIFNEKRNKLTDAIINKILLVRCNFNLL